MKFLLKIFVFLALLVISRLTREDKEAVAQQRPATKAVFVSYEENKEETTKKEKEAEKKTKKIASSF